MDEKVDVWEARKEEGRRLRGEREEVGREWERVVRGEMEGLRGRLGRLLGEGGEGKEEEEEGKGEEELRRRVEEALDGELSSVDNERRLRRDGLTTFLFLPFFKSSPTFVE